MNINMTSSRKPIEAIKNAAYAGQPEHLRKYAWGYEEYMDQLPVLTPLDPFLKNKITLTKDIMEVLRIELSLHNDWVARPAMAGFYRFIIGIDETYGNEIVIAAWGDGFSSPVHGHSAGYIYEGLIFGKILVTTYKIVDEDERIARPIKMQLVDKAQSFVSQYADPLVERKGKRQTLVHNFTSIGPSATLHYLPEHTRDGRDNGFTVEHFEDKVGLLQCDMERITSDQALNLRNGDVVLVRSSNVADLGDHFIVATGKPILKPWGLRIQEEALPTSPSAIASKILDKYYPVMGLVLLKLKERAAKEFLEFHGITVDNTVHFQEPDM